MSHSCSGHVSSCVIHHVALIHTSWGRLGASRGVRLPSCYGAGVAVMLSCCHPSCHNLFMHHVSSCVIRLWRHWRVAWSMAPLACGLVYAPLACGLVYGTIGVWPGLWCHWRVAWSMHHWCVACSAVPEGDCFPRLLLIPPSLPLTPHPHPLTPHPPPPPPSPPTSPLPPSPLFLCFSLTLPPPHPRSPPAPQAPSTPANSSRAPWCAARLCAWPTAWPSPRHQA